MSTSNSHDAHHSSTPSTWSFSALHTNPSYARPPHSQRYPVDGPESSNSQPGSRPDSPFPSTSFFEDALSRGLTPTPPTSFLHNILNPADSPNPEHTPSHTWSGHSYRPTVTPWATYYQPASPPTMPHPARRSNGYVDLTGEAASASELGSQTRRISKRPNPLQSSSESTPGPSTKRLKRSESSSVAAHPEVEIEEIDLSDDKITLQEALKKQREDAVKSQQSQEEGRPLKLSTLTCVICMDSPTDITATSCGHLFCHACLMEALIAGENRSAPGEAKRSQCPICRKFISRSKQTDIIPLLMKKGLQTQPRKSATPGVTPRN